MRVRNRSLLIAVALVLLVSSLTTGHDDDPKKRKKPPKPSPLSTVELDPLRMLKTFSDPFDDFDDDDDDGFDDDDDDDEGDDDDGRSGGHTIILAVDVSRRMQYDINDSYYDLGRWDKNASAQAALAASSLGVLPAPTPPRYYRRLYRKLAIASGNNPDNVKYTTESIGAVSEVSPDYSTFFDASRLGMARDGLGQVVNENKAIVRFGLVRSRQGTGVALPATANEKPVKNEALPGAEGDEANSRWKVTVAIPTSRNVDQTAGKGEVIVKADSSGASAAVLSKLQIAPDQAGALMPAGRDEVGFQDSPVKTLLDDAKAEAARLMGADDSKLRACRNAAVVLVVGGKDGAGLDPAATASTFLSVAGGGVTKRVPIYVIAVGPPSGDVSQLKAIATNSGGEYFEVEDADEVAYAANYAVQSIHRRASDFDSGKVSEFQTVSPIVGTVELGGAKDINGNTLPNTVLTKSGSLVPQRSNVLLTGGFALPGFKASLRAFRVYKPEADSDASSGYKFVKDATPLWVAHTPTTTQRNVFTYVPGSGMVALTKANAGLLSDYLRVSDAEDLIDFIRAQPLGALVDSTPAVMDPPSLLPAPDANYGSAEIPNTFAGDRAARRTLIFYGGNDGMLHAIDGRLGVEVWAFIPFNLLSKLRTLRDGQPVDRFDYFVDSSPKLSDVKVNGAWRTYVFIGQGPGGTFYQTFDVSDAGKVGSSFIDPKLDNEASVVNAYSAATAIAFKWAFPSYSSFDHTVSTTVTPFGDLKASASAAEKTVGQTWSDPAVGQIQDETGPYAMVTGSGFLGQPVEQQAWRGGVRAGTTLYVLDVANGSVMASRDVGDDTSKKNLKNALQGDPTAIGPPDSRFINATYIGDTEGNLWRFAISRSGSSVALASPVKIYDAKKDHPIYGSLAVVGVGTASRYIFFSTGSDLLPVTKKIEKFRLIGVLDTGANGLGQKQFEIKLEKADGEKGDERPASAPAVAGDVVFFTTTTEFPEKPCTAPSTSLFALTYLGGAAYDSNGDNKVDKKDKTVIKEPLGRSTSVFVSDQHLYFGTEGNVEVFGDPEDFNNGVGQLGVRLLSWREVR